jgi:hypothetical protein
MIQRVTFGEMVQKECREGMREGDEEEMGDERWKTSR